jgi:hypothetical protein
MAIDVSELQLLWPAPLFRAEAETLLASGYDDEESLGWLLDEAFAEGRGLKLFSEIYQASGGVWAQELGTATPSAATELVQALAAGAEDLPRYSRKAYYTERQRRREALPERPLERSVTRQLIADALYDLASCGYFEDAFGSSCTDNADSPETDGQARLAEEVKTDLEVWPVRHLNGAAVVPDGWNSDYFLDVLEALDHLVARPRRRWWHDYAGEWDYRDFSRRSGQAVLRWRINAVLDRSDMGLRLADSGRDAGLIVRSAGPVREALVTQVLATPDRSVQGRVSHAVELFRGRHASQEQKHSATRALADVLEQRKAVLKTELFTGDSNALFQIANQFGIRHMNEQQKTDYPTAFLDWVFWWYLATIELTDRLIADQDAPAGLSPRAEPADA